MKQTGIQKRAARRNRNTSSVDLNLVSLIDIFTILIFFLLINTGVADHPAQLEGDQAAGVDGGEAAAQTLVVMVSQSDIIVDSRKVAAVSDMINTGGRHSIAEGRTRPAGRPPGDPRRK
jgi:biopolymer transport protein ExbD